MPNRQFTITQNAGHSLTMDFAFHANWENKISVADQLGNVIVLRDNRHIGNAQAQIPKQSDTVNTLYSVYSEHKTSPLGSDPWIRNLGEINTLPSGQIRVGFQDQTHGTVFDNAIVVITNT